MDFSQIIFLPKSVFFFLASLSSSVNGLTNYMVEQTHPAHTNWVICNFSPLRMPNQQKASISCIWYMALFYTCVSIPFFFLPFSKVTNFFLSLFINFYNPQLKVVTVIFPNDEQIIFSVWNCSHCFFE